MNAANTLADLGMDSLMGAEIKQTLERSYDLVLSAQEIRGLTFGRLTELSSGADTVAPETTIAKDPNQVNISTSHLIVQSSP